MNGTYNEGEQKQSLQVTFEFQTKHNPANLEHLTMILKSGLEAKGLRLEEDLIIRI